MAVAALALLGSLGTGPGSLRAADVPWEPPPCTPGSGGTGAAGTPRGAWFVMEPVVNRTGTLVGQRVRVGRTGDERGRRIELPPESFATGPVEGRVLVGDDDGTRSRLRVLHGDAGCATEAGTSTDVIRGALLEPGGAAIVEHRVDRATRADLGVWRRPLDGGAATRVLAPLDADARYGPTFATELAFGADGALAVASCGERACRVRVLDPTGGRVRETGPTGPILGLAGGEVVAFDTCAGLPCRIEAIDPSSGRRRTLAEASGLAALTGGDRPVLVHEGDHGTLRALDVATGRTLASGRADGAAPLRTTSGAGAGASVPAGWALLGPARGAAAPALRALDPARLVARPLAEVAP